MIGKIASSLDYARPRKAAKKMLEHSMKDARRIVTRYTGRKLDARTGFLLGAAVALPLAYLAVRRLRG